MSRACRIVYIDYVKSITIYLVLLSHTALPFAPACWINSFHVPLFFFVSGFLFSYESNPGFVPFLRKKARQLLLSYLLIGAVTYLFWLLVGRRHGLDALSATPWYSPVVASLSVDVPGMLHNIPLWFFPSLFLVAVCCHPLLRRLRSVGVLAVSLAAGYAFYRCVGYTPFVVGQSVVAMFFYVLGYVFRRRGVRVPYWSAAILLPLSLCSVSMNDKVGMFINYYGNFPLFVMFAVVGILLVLVLSRFLQQTFGECRLVRLVSYNTLAICGFHLMMFTLLKGLMHYVFGLDITMLDSVLLPNVLFSLVALLLCIPLLLLLGRYMPWMIGARRRCNDRCM